MSYSRDFTIGVRETQDFYTMLTLRHWRKGLLGFAVVGALVAVLYTERAALPLPVRAGIAALTGLVTAGAAALSLTVSTRQRVKRQVRQSRRESYIQATEINGFGIHVTVGKDRARLPFENLLQVWETRKAFYLFLSEQQAWILPKNQMEDPASECEQIRTLLRTVVEKKRLRLKK